MTEAKPVSPSSHSFSITFRRLAGQISPEPRRRPQSLDGRGFADSAVWLDEPPLSLYATAFPNLPLRLDRSQMRLLAAVNGMHT